MNEDGMNEAALTDLAATVAERLWGTHEHVCIAIIRGLAAGQPVAPAHLAARLAMKEAAIAAVLWHMSDIDYDADGHIVGFGLSLRPTAHQFTINGQTLYTWCAIDTFIYTTLLEQPAQLLSQCPVTGRLAGTARDGELPCATVRLLDDGWHIIPKSATATPEYADWHAACPVPPQETVEQTGSCP
jgi:hypothetical protein